MSEGSIVRDWRWGIATARDGRRAAVTITDDTSGPHTALEVRRVCEYTDDSRDAVRIDFHGHQHTLVYGEAQHLMWALYAAGVRPPWEDPDSPFEVKNTGETLRRVQ